MKLRKMLALSLAAALTVGMAVSVSAAELDTVWYAEKNADVVAQVGDSAAALKQHYDTYGRKEGRMANAHDIEAKLRKLFDAEEYAALYPDVKAAFGEDEEAMFGHYISYGLLETRRPCMKVSYEAAVALKEAVAEAMEKAGIDAVPGSADVAAVIEGNVAAAGTGAEAAQVMAQVAETVEKAVDAAVESAEAPVSSGSSAVSTTSQQEVQKGPVGKIYKNVTVDSNGKITALGEPEDISLSQNTTVSGNDCAVHYVGYSQGIAAVNDKDEYCFVIAVPRSDKANMRYWTTDTVLGSIDGHGLTDVTNDTDWTCEGVPDGYMGFVFKGTYKGELNTLNSYIKADIYVSSKTTAGEVSNDANLIDYWFWVMMGR